MLTYADVSCRMQDLSGDGDHLDALLGVTVVTDVDLDAAADAPPAAGSAAGC